MLHWVAERDIRKSLVEVRAKVGVELAMGLDYEGDVTSRFGFTSRSSEPLVVHLNEDLEVIGIDDRAALCAGRAARSGAAARAGTSDVDDRGQVALAVRARRVQAWVADLLIAGERPIQDLASATGCQPDPLYRVLRTVAAHRRLRRAARQ